MANSFYVDPPEGEVDLLAPKEAETDFGKKVQSIIQGLNETEPGSGVLGTAPFGAMAPAVGKAAAAGAAFAVGVASSPTARTIGRLAFETSAPVTFLRGNPLVSDELEGMLERFPEQAGAAVEDLSRAVQQNSITELAFKGGEIAPELAAYASVFNAGRAVAVSTARKLGEKGLPLLAKVAANAADEAGALIPKSTPLVERLVQETGGSIGVGALTAINGLVSQDLTTKEALRDAGLATALTFGFGAGFGLLGKIPARGREVALAKVKRVIEQEVKPAARERLATINAKLAQRAEFTAEQLQVRRQVGEILRSTHTNLQNPRVRGAARQAVERKRDAALARLRDARTASRNVVRKRGPLLIQKEAVQTFLRQDDTLAGYTATWGGTFIPPNISGVNRFLLRLFGTADGLKSKMGPRSFRILSLADDASVDSFIARSTWSEWARVETNNLRSLYRQTTGKRATNKILTEIFDDYQAGVPLAPKYGPAIESVVLRTTQALDQLRGRMEKMGYSFIQKGGDGFTGTMEGVAKWFPQVFQDAAPNHQMNSIAKFLVSQGQGLDEMQALGRAQAMVRGSENRLVGIGINANRLGVGPTGQKIAAGLELVDNPFESAAFFMSQMEHKIAMAKRFGVRGELRHQYVREAERAGENADLLSNLLDYMLGFSYQERWYSRYFNAAINLQAAAKLSFAAIPNFFQQPANNPLVMGWSRSLKGIRDSTFRAESQQRLVKTLALHNTAFDVTSSVMADVGPRASLTARIADATLTATFFNSIERWNRFSTASSAHYTLTEHLAKAVAGKVKGQTLGRYRRIFADAGLDLDAMVRRSREGVTPIENADWMRAVFKLSRRTQFTPTAAVRPLLWATPQGRLLFQFNTFALNQGRLLRDYALAEAGRGNLGPLAHVLAIHPLIGEMTRGLSDLARGREPREFDNGLERLVSDYFMVGSFGILQTMMVAGQQTQRGTEPVLNLLGPTVRDANMLLKAALTQDLSPALSLVLRQPAAVAGSRIASLAAFTTEELLDIAEGLSDDEDLEPIPLQELIIRP